MNDLLWGIREGTSNWNCVALWCRLQFRRESRDDTMRKINDQGGTIYFSKRYFSSSFHTTAAKAIWTRSHFQPSSASQNSSRSIISANSPHWRSIIGRRERLAAKVWPAIGRDRPTPPIDYMLDQAQIFFFLVFSSRDCFFCRSQCNNESGFSCIWYCRWLYSSLYFGCCHHSMKFLRQRVQPNLGDSFKLFRSLHSFFFNPPNFFLFSYFSKGRENGYYYYFILPLLLGTLTKKNMFFYEYF